MLQQGSIFDNSKRKYHRRFEKLADNGVEIISCGLALDHYGVKEELKVGRISNMYEISSLMRTHHTIRP
ncbi:MAG: DsrE family protein [Anaerococcus obesiensis]